MVYYLNKKEIKTQFSKKSTQIFENFFNDKSLMIEKGF